MKKRRRLSSDGFKLFNLAYTHPPTYSKVKKMLFCLWHTQYDDKLEKMVEECREASKQLYSLHNNKSIHINKLINNAMNNLIYCLFTNDNEIANKHQVKQNFRYFTDVMQKCFEEEDHNTALMLQNALQHSSIKIFKFKKRKKDKMFDEKIDEKYGSWRNSYFNHLKEAMNTKINDTYIPSLMVLNIHKEKTKIYSSHTNLKNYWLPQDIEALIGLYKVYHPLQPCDPYPLFEDPPVNDNIGLMVIANNIKK